MLSNIHFRLSEQLIRFYLKLCQLVLRVPRAPHVHGPLLDELHFVEFFCNCSGITFWPEKEKLHVKKIDTFLVMLSNVHFRLSEQLIRFYLCHHKIPEMSVSIFFDNESPPKSFFAGFR